MVYVVGFINPSENKFYPNILTNHKGNAEQIIIQKGWYDEWRNDNIMRREAPDFLLFRKGFIQIGNSDRRMIIVSSEYYFRSSQESYLWRAIGKSLDREQYELVSQYYILHIDPPRF